MSAVAYDALVAHYGARVGGGGWVNADCPRCGKRAIQGQVHFHFNQSYGKCFVCGFAGSVETVARLVGLMPTGDLKLATPVKLAPVKLPVLPAPTWREHPEAVIARACAHPNRFPLWQAYRPLARATIRRYELGVGRLPDCACPHERLVYPVRQAGRVVGLYGRRIACRCQTAKTLMARGSVKTLFGVDDLVPFWPLVIVENPVDAALLNQECNTAEYGVQAVAVGSAGIW